jgi:hypothetical protein
MAGGQLHWAQNLGFKMTQQRVMIESDRGYESEPVPLEV